MPALRLPLRACGGGGYAVLSLAILGRRDFVKSQRPYREVNAGLPIEAESRTRIGGLVGDAVRLCGKSCGG